MIFIFGFFLDKGGEWTEHGAALLVLCIVSIWGFWVSFESCSCSGYVLFTSSFRIRIHVFHAESLLSSNVNAVPTSSIVGNVATRNSRERKKLW